MNVMHGTLLSAQRISIVNHLFPGKRCLGVAGLLLLAAGSGGCGIQNEIRDMEEITYTPKDHADELSPLEDDHTVQPNCENMEQTPHTYRIEFDDLAPSCEWSMAGNLRPEDGILTARTHEERSIDIQQFNQICGISFDFDPDKTGQSIVYDDELLLLVNDVVLMASDQSQVAELHQEDLFHFFNWEDLAGFPIDWNSSIPPYCIGETSGLSSCMVPDQQRKGEVSLELAPTLMEQLGEHIIEEDEMTFGMVTIGDNDMENDCSHSPFHFEVTVHAF